MRISPHALVMFSLRMKTSKQNRTSYISSSTFGTYAKVAPTFGWKISLSASFEKELTENSAVIRRPIGRLAQWEDW